MSKSKAIAIIVGRLGKDPELKYSKDGKAILTFSIAVDNWNSTRQENTTSWFDVVAFDKEAEYASRCLAKGSFVTVNGNIAIEEFTRKDGTKGKSVRMTARDVITPDKAREAAAAVDSASEDTLDDLPW